MRATNCMLVEYNGEETCLFYYSPFPQHNREQTIRKEEREGGRGMQCPIHLLSVGWNVGNQKRTSNGTFLELVKLALHKA